MFLRKSGSGGELKTALETGRSRDRNGKIGNEWLFDV
jgi:hypothetical protein